MLTNNNLQGILKKQLAAIKANETGEVEVFYNPNRPNKSFLVLPSTLGILFTLMLGITPSIAYIFKFYQ